MILRFQFLILKKIILFLQRADLAITDLTITAERESAADFTMPFMNLGEAFSVVR
jgi:hypothetical protein